VGQTGHCRSREIYIYIYIYTYIHVYIKELNQHKPWFDEECL